MGSVLITCTQPRADEIVSDLKQSGIQAIARPALTVCFLDNLRPAGSFDAMLLTSRHACMHALPDLPVIAIGEETADLANQKGLDVIQTGTGGIKDIDLSAYKTILYPCALKPTFIPQNATAWPVYKTQGNEDFRIPDTIQTVCVFSKRGAEHILSLCKPEHFIICLSEAVAKVFDNHPRENLAVCETPRYDAMKILIEKRHVQL